VPSAALSSTPAAAELIAEGIQLSPAMLQHHRLFNLVEALESSVGSADADEQQPPPGAGPGSLPV
jgi:hypothetical protein